MVKRQGGFTLAEVLVSMSIFMTVLVIILSLTKEMSGREKKLPINMMRHPQTNAVLARLRKDVLSGIAPEPFKFTFQGYVEAPDVVIIEVLNDAGFARTVVWDFRTTGQAIRREYNVGELASEWIARGVPRIETERIDTPNRPDPLHVYAKERGNLAIDQTWQPRAH